MTSGDAARSRVWSRLPPEVRDALTERLNPADLQTVLLDVAGRRAAAVSPADLMRRWRHDRFVQPSSVSPRVTARLEADLWEALPDVYDALSLSPVAPLGTAVAVTAASQDRIVTTTRGTEVVSDPTNVLALEASRRRGSQSSNEVHLAASARVVRAQPLGEDQVAHFTLFCLVSSGRDTGSGGTHSRFLTSHLAAWRTMLAAATPQVAIQVALSGWWPVLRERMADTVVPALGADPRFALTEDHGRERARGYYTDGALLVHARRASEPASDATEVGDGGFTSWTATLTQDAKERCLVSCVALERLAGLSSSA